MDELEFSTTSEIIQGTNIQFKTLKPQICYFYI